LVAKGAQCLRRDVETGTTMAINTLPQDGALTVSKPAITQDASRDNSVVATSFGRVALSYFSEIDAARASWLDLQSRAPSTCSQSLRWIEAWNRHVAIPKGAELAITIGSDEIGRPLFVWPFEVVTIGGMRVLRWMGAAHSNYNFAPIDPEFAGAMSSNDISALLEAAAAQIGDVSAAILINQPMEWEGIRNPFANLPYRAAPDSGYAATLSDDYGALVENRLGSRTRSSLRRKEKRIKSLGELKFGHCDGAAENARMLQVYFDQKANRFAEMGIEDTFADPCHQNFYRDLATGNNEDGRLELSYLKVGDEIAATIGAVRYQNNYNLFLLSMTDGEAMRWSPGLLLICEEIKRACGQSVELYDFGVGSGPHKALWCDQTIALFDSFVAFRGRGLLVTLPLMIKASLKRYIKSNARLWSLAMTTRRLLKGRTPSPRA
jgi:CelD/BcsL family acetyltransferase involved in cellulose biosynthesis